MPINWGELLDEALGDFTIAALPPTLSLPALPVAVTQFIQKSGDPKVEIKELAQIIETDSGLTIELLKHVNSAYIGARTRIQPLPTRRGAPRRQRIGRQDFTFGRRD